jgi:hypothetical protein
MIGNTGIGDGLLQIASGLMGIALIALILNRSGDATKLVKTGGSTFNDLLRTVTLQNGFGGFTQMNF